MELMTQLLLLQIELNGFNEKGGKPMDNSVDDDGTGPRLSMTQQGSCLGATAIKGPPESWRMN